MPPQPTLITKIPYTNTTIIPTPTTTTMIKPQPILITEISITRSTTLMTTTIKPQRILLVLAEVSTIKTAMKRRRRERRFGTANGRTGTARQAPPPKGKEMEIPEPRSERSRISDRRFAPKRNLPVRRRRSIRLISLTAPVLPPAGTRTERAAAAT